MNATPQKRGRAALVGFAILALAVGAVALGFHSATAADDHGNTFGTATPVTVNIPVQGILDGFGDKDYFVLQGVPPSQLRLVAGGQAFVPNVEIYDRFYRRIATIPGQGTQMQGPYDYVSPLPRVTTGPLYAVVVPAGRIGSYSLVLAVGTGETGGTPTAGTEPPPTDPTVPPPPGPQTPTDDVPAGTEHNFTLAGYFEGRIEVPGDADTLLYVVPADGIYGLQLTSEMPDAVADAMLPHTFHLNSWVPGQFTDTYVAGTEIRMTVHSLSELSGPYRLQVTPPPGMPMEPPAPPPPPPPGPVPTQPPLSDLLLVFNATTQMAPKSASNYQSWLLSNYRFSDPSINGEAVDSLAMRDRWIQIDNGVPGLKTMYQDPTSAFGSALAPFGGKSNARTRYPAWLRTQMLRMVQGGGTLEEIRAVIATGINARRPLILLGRRQSDSKAEAWVVFGWKTIGTVPNLVVVDPSMPGKTLNLPLGPGGIPPVGSGGALIKDFTLVGHTTDIIYP